MIPSSYSDPKRGRAPEGGESPASSGNRLGSRGRGGSTGSSEKVLLVGVGLRGRAPHHCIHDGSGTSPVQGTAGGESPAPSGSPWGPGRRQVESSLEELQGLAETAGAIVAGRVSQTLDRYTPGTLIGAGKVLEIASEARRLKINTVIFDAELSAAQQKNLEAEIESKIIDRTRLILDIFAQRARTNEGRIQVELAQLSYMLPRLTGAWRSFSQQVGGIGTRGPGERKLEYERRHIQNRIRRLTAELETVKNSRSVRRRKRLSVPVPQVAIIGYTNVGKSTLLNALTGTRDGYADDKLFATLDPLTRRVRLDEGGWAVFTDTVGFIQRLPTSLVAAFRSTLEEAALSDCLLVVSDASSPDCPSQEKAVLNILKDLGAEDVPQVWVYNKTDLLDAAGRARLQKTHPGRPLISAANGKGVKDILTSVQKVLGRRWLLREIDLPSWSPHASLLYESSQVLSERSLQRKIRYKIRVTQENWKRLEHLLKRKLAHACAQRRGRSPLE